MTPPSTIAHYKITAKLGEGGMGAVYRATDTKLHREVAIKVLPPSLANDPDRLARFTREAQVVASLNHPNIGAIYGVEEGTLILELIEGPTLAERIAQGPMLFDEALPLVRQLIEAIDHAHQKGVIHRDLKPANIKVTPEGKLKVLDFGLAKAAGASPQSSSHGVADSPTLTLTAAGTVAGVILGTAAYMAPEQARGKGVDKRADIWAFGVVVYELLTGRRLFDGETVGDVLVQTLTKPIDLEPLPAPARALLRRCLDRDSHSRLRDLGDAFDLLQFARDVAPQPAVLPRRPAGWMAAVLAGLLFAAVFAVLWQRAASRRESPLVVRMSLGDPRMNVAISPDGAILLLTAGDRLYLRRLDELRARPLPGTEGANWAFWAGDSSAIGFFQQGRLCILRLATQEIRVVASTPDPGGAAWRGGLAAGGEIVFVTAGKIMHLDLASGAVRAIPVSLPPGHVPLNPTFLPAGHDFVFTAGPPDADMRTLYRTSLQGGAPVRLMATPFLVQFARHPRTGNWYLFYSVVGVQKLMSAPVDAVTGQISGEPVQLVDGVGANPVTRRMSADVSPNGRIAFRRNFHAAPVFRIRWHAPDGKVLASLSDKLAANEVALSPDESQVAALTGYPRRSIFIYDARTGNPRRLTSPTENAGAGMAWSPDSRTLFYMIEQLDGTWNIVRHAADGSSRPETIGRSDFAITLMDISPDGGHLIFGPSVTAGSSYFRLRTAGTAGPASKPELWIQFGSGFGLYGAQGRFTPDGKFVLAKGGAGDARFIPWAPDKPGEPVNSGSVTFPWSGPFFSPDGRQLCGADREREGISCSSVNQVPGRPPVLGRATVLFSAALPQLSAFVKIGAIARDGRVLLLSTDEPEEVATQFLSDWTALLPAAKQ